MITTVRLGGGSFEKVKLVIGTEEPLGALLLLFGYMILSMAWCLHLILNDSVALIFIILFFCYINLFLFFFILNSPR